MGTEITLEVADVSLDWSKNQRGTDHDILFQEKDRQRRRSAQIDYDYFEENDEDPCQMEMGFFRPLREVVPRIELLGYTLENIKHAYRAIAEESREEHRSADDGESQPEPMSSEEFCGFVTAYPLRELDNTFVQSFEAELVQGRFHNSTQKLRIPHYSTYDSHGYSERSYFSSLIGCLSPYAILRLLALNPANLEAEVTWQYGPLVEAGYETDAMFVPGVKRTQTFLIATEGSSDAHILKRAFELLRPEIMDFFRFIDMTESHPFPGTGGLLKFAEGLIKIDAQNQIIFLFDNDAEGFHAYQRLAKQPLLPNMRAMVLPELDQFLAFPAQGPEGLKNANINGRAAAIECYLDLELPGYEPAKVVWTNYKKELGVYHGALDFKESYIRAFFNQTAENIAAGSYETDKLRAVLDAIYAEACLIAEHTLLADR